MGTILNNHNTDTGGTMGNETKVTIEDKIQANEDRQKYITEHIAILRSLLEHHAGLYHSDVLAIYSKTPERMVARLKGMIGGAEKAGARLSARAADLAVEKEVKAAYDAHKAGTATPEQQKLLAMTYAEATGADNE